MWEGESAQICIGFFGTVQNDDVTISCMHHAVLCGKKNDQFLVKITVLYCVVRTVRTVHSNLRKSNSTNVWAKIIARMVRKFCLVYKRKLRSDSREVKVER